MKIFDEFGDLLGEIVPTIGCGEIAVSAFVGLIIIVLAFNNVGIPLIKDVMERPSYYVSVVREAWHIYTIALQRVFSVNWAVLDPSEKNAMGLMMFLLALPPFIAVLSLFILLMVIVEVSKWIITNLHG